MELIELELEDRSQQGTSACRRMRRDGLIPGVVYAGGTDAIPVSISNLHFLRKTKGTSISQLYSLKSPNKALNGELALFRSMDVDPLRQEVRHFDLLHIQAGQPIVVAVAVLLEGTPEDVRLGEATIEQIGHEIEVECLPKDFVDKFVVDVSQLETGESIHAGDIPLPAGFVLKSRSDITIASSVAKRAEKEETLAAAEPAAAEAAPAKPAN